MDRQGNCITKKFVSGGAHFENFENSYERTIIEFHVDKIQGSNDTQTWEVTLNNGIRVPFNDEVVREAFVGTIVWDAKEPNCSATISQLNVVVMVKLGSQFAGLVL